MRHTLANAAAGFLLRFFEILVDSSLYLLIGFLMAGLLRAMVGPRRIRSLFGSGRVVAPIRAWLAATTLLPVCALGVLPVLQELKRSRAPRHAVLTFAIAAPMLNPISLVGCLSHLGPGLIVTLVATSFLVSVGAGVMLGEGRRDEFEPADDLDEACAESRGQGTARLQGAVVVAARGLTGRVGVDVLLGMAGAAAMAAMLTPSYLAESMFEGDHWAIGRMATIAPLTYATPDKGMAALPEMIKFRQSAGAMIALVVLGVGMTLGHFSWAGRNYGPKATFRWLATVLLLTLAVSHSASMLGRAVGTANSDNDHFNEFANPFEATDQWPDLIFMLKRFAADVEPIRWATLCAVLALAAFGVVARSTKKATGDDLEGGPGPEKDSVWDRPMPPRLVAGSGLGLFAAVLLAGAYAYFPSPSELFEDMNITKADFYGELGAKSLDPARHHLDLWERQASRLSVGSSIRLAPGGEAARRETENLRQALEKLRRLLDSGSVDEVRAFSLEVGQIQGRCRDAYQRN